MLLKGGMRMLRKRLGVILAAAMAFFLLHPGASTMPAASAEVLPGSYNLKLMTFNVRKMTADDGTPNSWNNRKDIAVHAIENFAPDVIGMQEADKVQIDYFTANLSGTYQSIGTSRTGSTTTDEFSNVMYRSDKFNLLDWGEFWLSETPDVVGSKSSLDTAYPRMCTWVKLQAKDQPNAVFYYFNTHLSQVRDAALQGAGIILNRAAQYVDSPDAPVFIGGDFNNSEVSQIYQTINNTEFDDTWALAGKSFANDGTYHKDFSGEINGPHFDWIFAKNILTILSIEISRYNENGFYPSDHYPLNLHVSIPLTTDTSQRPIGQTVWLKSVANGNYVSARANTTDSPLWASASEVRTWEKYQVVDAGGGFVALRALANNLYVTARISQTDVPLQARASSIGSWEKFVWVRNGDGTVSLRSIANNKYVSARINETNNPLEARIDTIATWEKFTWGN